MQAFISSEQVLKLRCLRKPRQLVAQPLKPPSTQQQGATRVQLHPGCLRVLLCAVLLAHLHGSVVPHTNPRHTAAAAATCCRSDFHASSTQPHKRVDCLSCEHVPVCVAILILWALRPCLIRSGTQCCWPAHSLVYQSCALYSADTVAASVRSQYRQMATYWRINGLGTEESGQRITPAAFKSSC